jgi:hypothetical protein
MQKLKWLSVLLPLLFAGAFPAATAGCVNGLEPACRKVGQECGFFIGDCCDGPAWCKDVDGRLTCRRP